MKGQGTLHFLGISVQPQISLTEPACSIARHVPHLQSTDTHDKVSACYDAHNISCFN
jgi:hypothetical protein